MDPVDQLVIYIKALREKGLFNISETIDGQYNHMGATLADAALQANNHYKTTVKPRVQKILKKYPDAKRTSDMIKIVKTVEDAKTFLDWKGGERAKRFLELLTLFENERVECESNLKDWLSIPKNQAWLQTIYGIGPKTVDYLQILAGTSTNAIDRHLLRFLEKAGIRTKNNYQEAHDIINKAAEKLDIDPAHFDHSIWTYMSEGSGHECS